MCEECGQTWDEKKYHPSDDGPLCGTCNMPLIRPHRGTDTIQWWLSTLRHA
jgi:NAD-dependent SIR2 family protein deacetylase